MDMIQAIKRRLPYTDATYDESIGDWLEETQILLQVKLNKTDEQVNDNAAYSGREQLLLSDYTAYRMLEAKVTESATGDASGEKPGNQVLKRAKADVTEVEFENLKAKDGGSLAMEAKELMKLLKMRVCATAAELGITLALCDESGNLETPAPFKYFTTS